MGSIFAVIIAIVVGIFRFIVMIIMFLIKVIVIILKFIVSIFKIIVSVLAKGFSFLTKFFASSWKVILSFFGKKAAIVTAVKVPITKTIVAKTIGTAATGVALSVGSGTVQTTKTITPIISKTAVGISRHAVQTSKVAISSSSKTIRRITKIEKNLISSKRAKNIKFKGRTVVKRSVYKCSKPNISLMLKGKAPLGFDGKRVNLHHLKQQKHGNLVELSATEHNNHSKVLHRYTKVSEISDRNSGYKKFRQNWWKSRASSCIARGM